MMIVGYVDFKLKHKRPRKESMGALESDVCRRLHVSCLRITHGECVSLISEPNQAVRSEDEIRKMIQDVFSFARAPTEVIGPKS